LGPSTWSVALTDICELAAPRMVTSPVPGTPTGFQPVVAVQSAELPSQV
jgi:hypothetical protein